MESSWPRQYTGVFRQQTDICICEISQFESTSVLKHEPSRRSVAGRLVPAHPSVCPRKPRLWRDECTQVKHWSNHLIITWREAMLRRVLGFTLIRLYGAFWMKFGKLSAKCWGLAMADFGRDPHSSHSLRGSRKNVCFFVR